MRHLLLQILSNIPRLETPTGLSSDGSVLYFNKVNNATSYSIYLNNIFFDTVNLTGTGSSDYLFDEHISIDENAEYVFSTPFTCNGVTYSALKVYGSAKAPGNTGKHAIYFDNTLVEEERTDTSSPWLAQAYRRISYTSAPTGDLLTFLEQSSESVPEQLSIDLSTLSGWESLANGSYTLDIIALATGVLNSLPSESINFGKNVEFVPHVIYGPYPVVRVVDGDTIVAEINGANMKIRMIGVNTPESVASSAYGHENCQEGVDASNYTKAQLTGRNVYIEFDVDQYDKYNRYLCYVHLDNTGNSMYNGQLVSAGYAEAQFYSPNTYHRDYLERLQSVAETNNVNFWGTGFFPTKLRAPVITLSGSNITWDVNPYAGSYDIRVDSTSVTTYTVPTGASQNMFDLSTLGLTSGNRKVRIRAIPTNTTHTESNLSNQVTYLAP